MLYPHDVAKRVSQRSQRGCVTREEIAGLLDSLGMALGAQTLRWVEEYEADRGTWRTGTL